MKWMNCKVLCCLILMVTGASASAEEKLVVMTSAVPKSFAEEIKKGAKPPGMKKMKPVDVSGITLQAYDMRGWFARNGLNIPKGGQAVYLSEARAVVVKASAASLGVSPDLSAERAHAQPITLGTEFFLVGFKAPEAVLEKALTYGELRKAAGESWALVDMVRCQSKSGERMTVSSRGDRATVDAEAVVGPDGNLIDVHYRYSFNGKEADGQGFKLNTESATTTGSGIYTILQMAGPTKAGGPTYALLMRSSVLLPGNVPLPPVEKGPADK